MYRRTHLYRKFLTKKANRAVAPSGPPKSTPTEWVMAGSTLLLFFATLGLYWATRDLVHDADRNARRQLRAYVATKPVVPDGAEFQSGMTASVGILFENVGQTPALGLTTTSVLFIREHPLKAETDLVVPPNATPPTTITLHPNQTVFGLKLERQIDLVQYQAISLGIGRLYAFGTVNYEDIFGVKHWTRFCYEFVGTSLSNWHACWRNNDTDK